MLLRTMTTFSAFVSRWIFSPKLLITVGLAIDGKDVPFTICAIFNALTVGISLWILHKIYILVFSSLDLYRDENAIGYVHHDERVSREDSIRKSQRRKKIGNSPPVYPNGWFRIMDSQCLKKGKVKSVYVFGQQLAVFRNKRGIVRVMDAYCPHLGANMAAGGKVVNSDCLECPFHGWKFSGETGKLVDIPYAQKVPAFVSVPTWPCREVNGVVYVWHHCDKIEPQWRMPEAEGLNNLKYVGRTEHIINAHIQDIPENGADIAHLDHLHKPVIGSDVEKTNDSMLNNLVKHQIQAKWKSCENPEEKHCSSIEIEDHIHLHVFGIRLHLVHLKFRIKQIGAGAVHIYVQTPFFRGLMVQNVTPVEPFQQRLSHSFYISPWVPICVGKAFYLLETTQIERDILMWNNKTYLRKPVLVKEESVLGKHRRWYQQFYSENSPKADEYGNMISMEKPNIADW